MKALIYVRQSLAKDGDTLGVERQEEACRQLCAARGYEVLDVIADNSVSATTGKRAGYEQLVERIAAHECDVVVVLRVDRLLRKLTDLEALIELTEQTGVRIVTVEGDLQLDTSTGRLLARIVASVARAEVETKSARHKLANMQKAKAGKPHGSRRPFGFNDDQMTLRDEEAAVLRQMAEMVLSGHSFKHVAYWLNEQGHRTTTGKQWFPITVRNMLQKPRYAGIREYNGQQFSGAWTPVFDHTTWERLQLVMKLRSEGYKDRPRPRKFMLTGLVYCECGAPMNGQTKRDRPDTPKRRLYFCRRDGDTARFTGCGKVRRGADPLEDWIKEAVLYRLDVPELAQMLDGGPGAVELKGLLDERQLQQHRLDGLVDDYACGLLSREQLERAKPAAETRLREIDAAIDVLQRKALKVEVPAGQTVRAAWDAADTEWRHNLLSILIKRIVVHGGNTKPYYKQWRFDPNLIEVEWIA